MASFLIQGIAVNSNLTYSILERTGSTSVDEPRLLVVACDRVDALKDVIGPHKEIDRIKGGFTGIHLRPPSLTIKLFYFQTKVKSSSVYPTCLFSPLARTRRTSKWTVTCIMY